ncbi:MAG TPA: SDR family oxidoreductase [Burkholderiales bacterium]|nr:SDR family oxidoreductase [Burkholderiales bacterium]
MDFNLQGRIALVSGASGGIGRVTAKLLASEGVQTIVVARRERELQELSNEIAAEGGPAPMIVVEDLTQRDAFQRIRDRVLARFGHVDILVNNLGQARPLTWDSPDADWDEAFALNFTPARKLAELFIPGMREHQFGRIVNLTATLEPSHVSGSLTSKAAVLVWAKGLSRVVGRDGITVNCVSPGILLTEQIRQHHIPRWLPSKEDQERFLTNDVPMGRFGDPIDAARLIVFLCSPLAGYITGQRIYVDGGWNRYVG